MMQHNWNADNVIFESCWSYYYKLASAANSILANKDEYGIQDQYIAEARLLRAYAYYNLMDLFGNVPIICEDDGCSGAIPENSSRKAVFEFIESELNDPIMDNLKDKQFAKMDKGVLHTLKARLYLNSKVFLGLEDDSDEYKAYLEKCIEDELLCSFGGGERFKFQIERLLEIVVYAAKNTVRSIVDSGFIPEEFEYDLSFDFGKVKIAGKCDRYDVSKADNKSYVRVVDYKRGKESVPMSNLYKGSDLQMFLYLFGICEKIKAEPSSVMYQPINGFETKNAEVGNLNEQAERLKIENVINHTMNGVIIEKTPEEKAREKLEKSLEEDCGEKKGGYSNSVTISSDAYESLKKYCEAYVNAMTVEAGEGVITAFPKNKDSCRYCDYRFFCGYDKDEEEENDE